MHLLRPSDTHEAGWGLYIHIPFCVRKCPYCDFTVAVLRNRPEADYVAAVLEELQARALTGPLRTVYLGGGTPGLLEPDAVRALGQGIRAQHDTSGLQEWTVEFNPEHADDARLAAWIDAGATRISLGVQALAPASLALLGRPHAAADVLAAIARAKAHGFAHISIDFIFALPGIDPAVIEDDLRQAVLLDGVDHISMYELTVETRTVFGAQRRAGILPTLRDDDIVDHWRRLSAIVEGAGFERYEVSNYARPGGHARHNASYWYGRPYVGIGVGAASMVWENDGVARRTNRRQLRAYLAAPLEGADTEHIAWSDHLGELLTLGVRTRRGIDLAALEARFSLPMPQVQRAAEKLASTALLTQQGRHFAATNDGMEIADTLALRLLDALDLDLDACEKRRGVHP